MASRALLALPVPTCLVAPVCPANPVTGDVHSVNGNAKAITPHLDQS
jgi:hypothetical protein